MHPRIIEGAGKAFSSGHIGLAAAIVAVGALGVVGDKLSKEIKNKKNK